MISLLKDLFTDHELVIILGFGREGKSTYRMLRKWFSEISITIADVNLAVEFDEEVAGDSKVSFSIGKDYQKVLATKAVVFKSPGVTIECDQMHPSSILTSQTNLFIQRFHQQMIGVSGTKGKSTTSSLIFYLLDAGGLDAVLLGNIGIPAFDKLDVITQKTWIVFELSAHQLQHVQHSPHIAVLLNIFPEHLDYFSTVDAYREAKFNLFAYQNVKDFLIVPDHMVGTVAGCKGQVMSFSVSDTRSAAVLGTQGDSILSGEYFSFPKIQILGQHNKLNVMAAMLAAHQAGIDLPCMIQALPGFRGLPHRLEYVAKINGVEYYNDSISTIPASAMAAIEALQQVGSLILGGYDRGLDYHELVSFLEKSNLSCVVFLGEAGKRMMPLFSPVFKGQLFWADSLAHAVKLAGGHTPTGKICLLSPAAASYDQFHNFEHRGDTFKELVFKMI